MESVISEINIERDKNGYWIHPEWAAFINDRERIPDAELNDWLNKNSLEIEIRDFEGDADQSLMISYFENGDSNISAWQPTPPSGSGWFIVSIGDSEDGPFCVWLRKKDSNNDEKFEIYASHLVPLGQSTQEWNEYAKLLVIAVAKKLYGINESVAFTDLYYWCLAAQQDSLEDFCRGTKAEFLFGSEKYIASARAVLKNSRTFTAELASRLSSGFLFI
ncbi:type IV secretion system DNA-binding domain-containing protein [Dickeya dadantii]|uniref:type IV secretion system DNA-binding domain-containing protein n=1 Tax=Dickeya dadantii TaxID=204038 RepID=UPI0014955E32|nr:type IV secretion system DNA-binding domain-containing protein [Dickeya dadantii]NPE55904.1 type IV secretion system DNA-binding domain-containing protein [Dickeya dadantii]NPE67128.1 type IV secretion system DNA-binding domain-containing protein [Dickeya dadantii]